VDRTERIAQLESQWQVRGIVVEQPRVVKARLEDVFVLMLSAK